MTETHHHNNGDLTPQPDESESAWQKFRRILMGKPRNLADKSIFHHLSLVPFLAWVGLGADGLSSSAYGPEEAFVTLGEHKYLAIVLILLTTLTIIVIATIYSRIIEAFPHGGGGYVVATKLLGSYAGLVSGSALIIDYVFTITVSIAAAGDALFSFLPMELHQWKLSFEIVVILLLIVTNSRGVKESVIPLTPVFGLFLITHIILIVGAIFTHAPDMSLRVQEISSGFSEGYSQLGFFGLFAIFIHAYSLGSGTYTGIEAVSNGLPIIREPRVSNARRTMFYMAASLAFTAGGLMLCYLLWDISPVVGKTLNAVLIEQFAGENHLGQLFVYLALVSEGFLLIVASQAGFIDGPRVLANMAVDSWAPHRFAALSDRLTTMNGILLMGIAALVALVLTHGSVKYLVVMYSINVFVTFSLSFFGMLYSSIQKKSYGSRSISDILLYTLGFILCFLILIFTVHEKFYQGGWITLFCTGGVIALCMLIRRHYQLVPKVLAKLYSELGDFPAEPNGIPIPPLDPNKPTAVVLVGGYGVLGVHTVLNIFRTFPNHFKNLVFISIGVIDSGLFKGEDTLASLQESTETQLRKYVELAHSLGIPATYKFEIGTEAVETGEKLCLEVADEFLQSTFFAGKVLFQRDRWYQRILHNETALAIQKRLQWNGKTMVIIPARVNY